MNESNFPPFLIIPSFMAISIALVLLINKKWRTLITGNILIQIFFTGLLLLNVVEFLNYSNLFQLSFHFMQAYYVLVISIFGSFFCICGQLSGFKVLSGKPFYWAVFFSACLLILLVVGSDFIIKGMRLISYTHTKIPGDYYWVFEIYVITCLAGGAVLMVFGIINAENLMEQKRRTVVFISFLPTAVTVVTVIILMKMGYQVTLALLSSVITICFMVVYIYTYNKHDLFKFLIRIPFSKERKAYKKITSDVIDYISETQTDNKVSLREFLRQIENSVVSNALELKKGDHSLAAELLKTSTSTIYRHKNSSKGNSTDKPA